MRVRHRLVDVFGRVSIVRIGGELDKVLASWMEAMIVHAGESGVFVEPACGQVVGQGGERRGIQRRLVARREVDMFGRAGLVKTKGPKE